MRKGQQLISIFFFIASILVLAGCVSEKKVADKVKVSDRDRFENDDDEDESEDIRAPEITSVTKPSNRWYGLNQYLTYTVKFDEPVTVTGTPYIKLTTDNGERQALYASGSGSTDIVFRYRVASGDSDVNGIVTDNIIMTESGTLTDSAGNVADLVIGSLNTAGVNLDPVIPNLLSISNVAAGEYRHVDGDELTFTIVFDKTVNVTGTPRIQINLGSGTAYATYAGGTGTTTLSFTYTVGASDLDLDGIALVSPINVSGASIRDRASNNAIRTFTVPVTTGVTVVPDSLVLWLDASDESTIFDAEGDAASGGLFDDVVCEWQDKSYRAHTLTPHAIDGNCLTYQAGVVSGGGDSAGQCLSVTLTSGLASSSGATVMSVARFDDDLQSEQTLLTGEASGVGAFPYLGASLSVDWNYLVGGADDYWERGTGVLAAGTWEIAELGFNSGTYAFRRDGVSETLSFEAGVAAADTGALTKIHLGCDQAGDKNMYASMAEIFIFEADLSTTAKNHLRTYLNSKWGL